jgi:TP901 family phage tail tape measure protein
MTDVNANIKVSIDTSQAQAQLRQLQSQISSFNQSFTAINSQGAQQAQAMNRALMDGVNATKMFNARIVPVTSTVDRFSKSLEKGQLSLGEYSRYAASQLPGMSKVFSKEFSMMERVVTDRVKRMQTQYVALGKSSRGLQEAMAIVPNNLSKGYGTEMAMASQRQQVFNRLIDDGSTKLLNWGKNTQWAGRQLMVGFTLPLAALGTVAAQTFMEIDKATVAFERVYGDLSTTTSEMNKNRDALMDLGKEYTKYGISVSQALDTGARVAATGLSNNDMLQATEQTLRFATLGQMDYNTALDATISLQSAFKIESEDLATKIDFLNAVENQTVLTIQDMAAAIPRVAPVIKGLGGSVEDLAVFLTAMREGGVSAEQGANALKSGLASLINPTNRAQEALSMLGINMTEIINQNRGDLLGTVKAFGDALSVVGEFEQQQALEQIFGKYQYARMGALFDNIADSSSQASRAMDLMGMSMEELAQLSEKELSKIEESTTVKFQAALENLKLSIAPLGEAFLKGIMPIMEFLSNIANAFNNLPDPVKNAIAVITGVIGGLGPVFLMTIGLIGNGLANLTKGIQFLRKTLAAIRGDASNFTMLAAEELEAKGATEALEGSVQGLTGSLLIQKRALSGLIREYERYAIVAGIAGSSARRGAGRVAQTPPLTMAKGGVVPGTGSGDKVPALLEPGESVVTKKASQSYGPVIAAMNAGTLPGYQGGLSPRLPMANLQAMTFSQSQGNVIDRSHLAGLGAEVNGLLQQLKNALGSANPALRNYAEALLANINVVNVSTDGQGAFTSEVLQGASALQALENGIGATTANWMGTAVGTPSQRNNQVFNSPAFQQAGLGAGDTLSLEDFNAQVNLAQTEFMRLTNQTGEAADAIMDADIVLERVEESQQAYARGLLTLVDEGKRVEANYSTESEFLEYRIKQIMMLTEIEKGVTDQQEILSNATRSTSAVMREMTDAGIVSGGRIVEMNTALQYLALVATETANTLLVTSEPAAIQAIKRGAQRKGAKGQANAIVGQVDTDVIPTGTTNISRKSLAAGATTAIPVGVITPEQLRMSEEFGRQRALAEVRGARQIYDNPQNDPYTQSRDRNSPHRLAAKDGRQDAQAYIAAQRSELGNLRQARGMGAKEMYKTTQSEQRRTVRDRGRMSDAGMSQAQIARVEGKILQGKIKEERIQAAKLRAAQKAVVSETQSAATEEKINLTLRQRLANLTKRNAQDQAGAMPGMGRAGMIGMGLGMASMVPFMAQNEEGKFAGVDANALGMGMMGTGMAFDMVGMAKMAGKGGIIGKIGAALLGLSVPLAAVTLGVTAFAVGMKIWRNNVDSAARAASDLGANLGATANALNTATALTGTTSPIQRQTQMDLNLGQQLSEGVAQWNATFEDGAGKKFIDDLKEATSEQRFTKLGDVIRYAIAAGAMDAAQAKDFSDAVALSLGDTVLGLRARSTISQAQQGSESYLGLARGRASSVSGSSAATELEGLQSAYKKEVESVRAYNEANKNRGKQGSRRMPLAPNIGSDNANLIIGGSMQVIQDFANAAALAGEEFSAGKISQDAYAAAVQESDTQIDFFTDKMLEAMKATGDLGGSMEALRYQLEQTGLSAEQAEMISNLEGLMGVRRDKDGARRDTQVASKAEVRTAAASAAMQGVSTENIQALMDYMSQDKGAEVNKLFGEMVSGGNASDAFSMGMLRMTAEQGGIPGLLGATEEDTKGNINKVMNIALEFTEEGGSTAEFQQFLATLPQDNLVVEVETAFAGMDAAEKKQYIDDYNKLAEQVGIDMAKTIQDSESYKTDSQGTTKSVEGLAKIFGSDQETIQKYIEVSLEENPDGLLTTLPATIEDLEILNSIPPNIRSVIGIDLTDPESVDKYGPMAEGILQLVPALEALPEGEQQVAVNMMTKSNGEIKDPIAFAKDVAAYQKTMNKLSSSKKKVRKEAAIELLTTLTGPNGEMIDPKDAPNSLQRILENTGLTEAEFLQLPPDTISKLIGFQVQIDGAGQSAEAFRQSAVIALAMGDQAAYDRYMAAATALDSAKASQITTAAAGIVTGGNEFPAKDTGGGGGGGDKANPFKEMKQAILNQIKMYADMDANMKSLFSKKFNFLDMAMKNKGIDDKIAKLNLTPALAEQISSMDPKDAKNVLNKISKGGKLNAQGKQINRAALAGSIAGRTDSAAKQVEGAQAQMSALADLQRRGAGAEAIQTIAGDPVAAKEYLGLVREANRAQKKLADAGEQSGKKLRGAYKKAKDAVQEYIDKIVEGQQKEAGTQAVIDIETDTATNKAAASALSDLAKLNDVNQDVKDWAQENPQEFGQILKGYDGNIKKAIKAVQDNLNSINAIQTPEQQQQTSLDTAYNEIQDQNEKTKAQFEMIFVELEQKYENLIDAAKQRIDALQDGIKVVQNEIDALQKLNDADNRRIRALDRQKEMMSRQIESIERVNELDQRRVEAINRQSEMISRQVETLDRQNELDQRRADALSRQVEMMSRQQESVNDQISAQERLNELDQRSSDELSRADELRQRQSEAISRELDLMSRKEEDIRSAYDERIKQLDDIEKAQKRISDQAQGQLDLAKALSTGDIYAATAAAQQMRENQMLAAKDDVRTAMQQGMESQVAGLRTSGGLTKAEAEGQVQGIGDQSYQTQLLIRDIQDQIYLRSQGLIPLKDQIYAIDQNIKLVNDEILIIQDGIYTREQERIPFLDEIYNLGLSTRDIEDAIYNRNLELVPIKDAIYNKELEIRGVQDAIFNRETEIQNIQVSRLSPLQDALDKENEKVSAYEKQLAQEKAIVKVGGMTFKQLQQQIQSQAAIYAYSSQLIKQNNKNANSVKAISDNWASVISRIAEANRLANSRSSAVNATAAARSANFVADPDSMLPVAQQAKAYQQDVDRWLNEQLAQIDSQRDSEISSALGSGKSGMASGGMVLGDGARDSIMRILSPGEYVVNRAMVNKYGAPMLDALNTGSLPKYKAYSNNSFSASSGSSANDSSPVYNTYSVNVNVPNANINADEVANKVLYKIKSIDSSAVRGYRGF